MVRPCNQDVGWEWPGRGTGRGYTCYTNPGLTSGLQDDQFMSTIVNQIDNMYNTTEAKP